MLKFIEDAHLVDYYHEKFPESSRTFTYGSKRLDMILFDPALIRAIERMGYLGTCEEAFSDHVYVDLDKMHLFWGQSTALWIFTQGIS